MTDYVMNCSECGKSFTATRSDAEFCTKACYLRKWRRDNKHRKYTLQGLTKGEQMTFDNIQRYSPKTAKQIKSMIEVKGAKSVKPILSVMVQFMADTGKLHTLFTNGSTKG